MICQKNVYQLKLLILVEMRPIHSTGNRKNRVSVIIQSLIQSNKEIFRFDPNPQKKNIFRKEPFKYYVTLWGGGLPNSYRNYIMFITQVF